MTSVASSLPSPISISTSQAWDNDGAGIWSTFVVQVGTPAQNSRVIMSSACNEIWVVVEQGCSTSYGSDCTFDRGNIFSIANSTSWVDIALYELDLELNLGYTGNGDYGYDTVTLGYPNSGGPELKNQVVAGIAAPDFWFGLFGLDPAPSNFTTLDDPQPSFLWSLVNQSMIPSSSWGYTAGAYYRYNEIQGSLILGGYDTSRFDSKNVSFPMYDDVSRRYVVELRSITYIPTGVSTATDSITLTSTTISMLIDSTVPYIYLPTAVCDDFASAFGLEYNSTNDLYTINSTMHTSLQSLNPNITFTLANTDGETLDIVLPYAAFDLTATFPVLPEGTNSTTYFPLKRAANDTQYTLGRVFLQEAYLIADFDRSQFTVAPCVWPSTFTEHVEAIYPPSVNISNAKNATMTTTARHGSTPVGAVVGGVIGGLALISLAIIAYWYFVWKRKHRRGAEYEPTRTRSPSAIDQPVSENTAYEEAVKKRWRASEIAGTPILRHEIPSPELVQSELDSPQVFEMPAREAVGSELSNSTVKDRSITKR